MGQGNEPVRVAPSGEQYGIAFGEQRATIVEVGGGVREYRWGPRNVLDPYPVGSMCDGAHGTPLVPWPNRLGDGRYTFAGEEHQVALTEPSKRNAIHGFLRWRPWRAVAHEAARVVMAARIHPRSGYPFTVDVQVEYSLGADGLTVRTTATNLGDVTAPYGCGHHPYLSPGDGMIDGCTLHLEAGTRIVTDEARQLPTGTEPVEGTRFDLRGGRVLAGDRIDHAYGDLARDAGGRAWARLTGLDGATAEIWADAAYPYLEIYTGDTLAPGRRRRGLGVEPMTCPPDAFRSGIDLVHLEPGATHVATWGARLAPEA